MLDKPLFADEIQAWVHGPVVISLYPHYVDFGWEDIPKKDFNLRDVNKKTVEVLDAVYRTYSPLDGDQLESLTHSEQPWKDARGTLKPWENCRNVISCDAMRRYYKTKYEQAQGE